MKPKPDLITVQANIDIPTLALKRIVEQVKQKAGLGERGYYQVDTAAAVGNLISQFLLENDFEAYTAHPDHYDNLL